MLEKIRELLPDYCEDLGSITEETAFAGDIGMSSMDFFMFINNLEDEFGVKFEEEELHELLTVGDVIRCLKRKKA